MARRHEITRLEGFSDAVFAFALTLLVVSLEVPESFEALRTTMLGFLPFALTFAMICWFWYEHQRFFRRFGMEDAWTVTLNCVLLFVVLFYVYPLKFLTRDLVGPLVGLHRTDDVGISQHGDIVLALYSVGVVLIFGTFVALYRHAWRQRELLGLDAAEEVQVQSGLRGHALSGLLGVLSLIMIGFARQFEIGWLVPMAGFIYMLLGPVLAWNGVRTGRALRALALTESHAKR